MTDPVARDRLAALLREDVTYWEDRLAQHPEDATVWADRLLAAGVLPPDTLAKVRAICDEWGGTDSWGVHYIYTSTLLERLAALEAGRLDVDKLLCGQCGDWNTLDELDGHLASEGRQTEARRVLDALETFDRLVPPPAAPGHYPAGIGVSNANWPNRPCGVCGEPWP